MITRIKLSVLESGIKLTDLILRVDAKMDTLRIRTFLRKTYIYLNEKQLTFARHLGLIITIDHFINNQMIISLYDYATYHCFIDEDKGLLIVDKTEYNNDDETVPDAELLNYILEYYKLDRMKELRMYKKYKKGGK